MSHHPAFSTLCENAKKTITEVTLTSALANIKANSKHLLIDVREDHEWDNGHIDNAIHLGRGILERDIFTVASTTDTPLYLYCGGGYRSALAAQSLQLMGFTQVKSIQGGYKAWLKLQESLKSN